KNPRLTLWITIRFMIFGIGGFFALWTGWVMVIDFLNSSPLKDRWSLLGFPLALTGGLMMLFGSGTWKRWAYLWVFFSAPISAAGLPLFGYFSQKLDEYIPADEGLLFFIAPMPISYWLVRRYYKRREVPQPSSAPTPQITTNEEGSR